MHKYFIGKFHKKKNNAQPNDDDDDDDGARNEIYGTFYNSHDCIIFGSR